MNENKPDIEAVNKFSQWLQTGESQEEISIDTDSKPPRMNAQQAYAVVFYLQEVIGLVPDSYELCARCQNIFDFDNEGMYLDDGYWHEQSEYYIERGISEEELIPAYGNFLCSESCELSFIRAKKVAA
jgi:hypothetical protein